MKCCACGKTGGAVLIGKNTYCSPCFGKAIRNRVNHEERLVTIFKDITNNMDILRSQQWLPEHFRAIAEAAHDLSVEGFATVMIESKYRKDEANK